MLFLAFLIDINQTAIKQTQCKQLKLKKFNHKYYYKNDEYNQSYNVMVM